MKTSAGILIYDDNCPLCCWYTKLFVRWGLLLPEHRKAFSMVDQDLLNQIGLDKSRNEIPLLNPETGKVVYGVEALLEILGLRFPLIKKIGYIRPVNWFLKKLYKLVSYNRKVIVAKTCAPCTVDCTPDLNYRYRLTFLLLSLLFISLMLIPVTKLVLAAIPSFELSTIQVLAAHFILLGINCMLALSFSKKKMVEYLGQVNMVALLGILLIMPLMFSLLIWSLPVWGIILYLALITIILFREYLRRMNYANILPSNTWVAGFNLAGMMGFILFLFR
jgi:predicted DCC family thiol-disulfide oxidoreductase YuxK